MKTSFLLVTSYQLLITSYQSLVISCQSLVTSYQSLVTSHQLLVTTHQLLVTSLIFRSTSYRPQAAFRSCFLLNCSEKFHKFHSKTPLPDASTGTTIFTKLQVISLQFDKKGLRQRYVLIEYNFLIEYLQKQPSEMFYKKAVLKNFAIFARKHVY